MIIIVVYILKNKKGILCIIKVSFYMTTYQNEQRLRAFEKELKMILNPNIRKFAEEAIKTFPDYFFEVGASSTSKYHPAYALGFGGLLRHTQAAVKIAVELFRIESYDFTDDEKDLIIVSLICHDGWKHGTEYAKFTIDVHPLIAGSELSKNKELRALLPANQFEFVIGCVEHHMGDFVQSYKTQVEVLERPQNKFQEFVHLADYLASRKFLEVKFD